MDILSRTISFYKMPQLKIINRRFTDTETKQHKFIVIIHTGQFFSQATGSVRRETIARCAVDLTQKIINTQKVEDIYKLT